jgi:5-hydroxyisourate hydrolase
MPARLKLTTHVLDTASGRPASGMKIELWFLENDHRLRVCSVTTNAQGRTDSPLLDGDVVRAGEYELLFFVGDYFAGNAAGRFLDIVPVRVNLADGESYHVPLLCSPWSYTTYRGS